MDNFLIVLDYFKYPIVIGVLMFISIALIERRERKKVNDERL